MAKVLYKPDWEYQDWRLPPQVRFVWGWMLLDERGKFVTVVMGPPFTQPGAVPNMAAVPCKFEMTPQGYWRVTEGD